VSRITQTPVRFSPAMIARSIGAAPRQCGSSEGWMLSSGHSESSGSRTIWPKAQTMTASGRTARIRASDSSSLTAPVCSSSMPSSVATSAAGGDCMRRPRPLGRSGGVTTSSGRWVEVACLRSTSPANSDVPR